MRAHAANRGERLRPRDAVDRAGREAEGVERALVGGPVAVIAAEEHRALTPAAAGEDQILRRELRLRVVRHAKGQHEIRGSAGVAAEKATADARDLEGADADVEREGY